MRLRRVADVHPAALSCWHRINAPGGNSVWLGETSGPPARASVGDSLVLRKSLPPGALVPRAVLSPQGDPFNRLRVQGGPDPHPSETYGLHSLQVPRGRRRPWSLSQASRPQVPGNSTSCVCVCVCVCVMAQTHEPWWKPTSLDHLSQEVLDGHRRRASQRTSGTTRSWSAHLAGGTWSASRNTGSIGVRGWDPTLVEQTNGSASTPSSGGVHPTARSYRFPGLRQGRAPRTGTPGSTSSTRFRDRDEAYWKQWRGTPRRSSMRAGQRIWGTDSGISPRFDGSCRPAFHDPPSSSNRVMPGPSRHLRPADLRMVCSSPSAELARKVPPPVQDFGGLFISSSFPVVASLLLTSMLFQFALDLRLQSKGSAAWGPDEQDSIRGQQEGRRSGKTESDEGVLQSP